MEVFQAPVIHLLEGTVRVHDNQAAPAELECRAEGQPRPLVTWQRHGVRVESGARYTLDGTVRWLQKTTTLNEFY